MCEDFGKLELRYYFLNKLQEKDFFDKKEKINKRLNMIIYIIQRKNIITNKSQSEQINTQK